MAQALVELLQSRFPDAVVETHAHRGDETVVVHPARWREIAQFLRDSEQADMQMLVDLTAVDFPEREPRFEVVAHLHSLNLGLRLRLKARVGRPDGSGAEIESLTPLWASANWLERECWDMLGIRFTGHPDLRRILLYPQFEGHPVRKDYPAEKTQPLVPYRDADNIEKLPPFDEHEGMPFGRRWREWVRGQDEEEDLVVPEEADS
jgi:NADH-quinone oxidoreductase subunit C